MEIKTLAWPGSPMHVIFMPGQVNNTEFISACYKV